ncbi:hypothetical protein FOXG_21433 [Fusarium oxysporum f. sp. lycopersici 4287]|uniref:Uncharacterized protein n=1 Tax=Fusarium oxysporum f. sp. lycopersici (strain 4287 / CBS 123668 / FGSC 9935 / NRRL 34936) TaxID=426428 RepID=A0A0J9VY36_FUSO4|nr:hypothetical protein FOXG_20861 [Fusarium oxysporum f. sp. lycopersici 4287]XP_018253721.1 hypothetical protein FOXG_21433 [Fusarium oxysporum f. sp. lycopersici 4287]KNB13627.1 hypothetical protein FOXG_20861 [Fusarium oxysporum f. sp. lycopersici 4287]KNB15676.1 hypothetical protein FOXG_21433 [Fusarium oxysporum f. sp. lycopersici 4287]
MSGLGDISDESMNPATCRDWKCMNKCRGYLRRRWKHFNVK